MRNGGGRTGAVTEPEWTAYTFTCVPDALEDTLSRFSTVFCTPNLHAIDVGGQVMSVHSEFLGMQVQDQHRLEVPKRRVQ